MLGMILLKTYNDSVSHHELLTQYEHINNIYNGHMNILIALFTVGITVVGILLPIFITYIQNRRFDKELEILKVDLKKEMNEENYKKIAEKTKELEDSVQKDLEYLKTLIIIDRHYSLSTLLITQKSNNYSLSFSIRAFLVSIEKGVYDRVDHILDDLDLYSERKFKFDFKEIEMELEISIPELYKKLKSLSNNDERKVIYVQRFQRKLNSIRDKQKG